MCVCCHSIFQTLTSPPVSQGNLLLPFDLAEAIKPQKSLCHSFSIIVILFCIIVIPFLYHCHSFPIIVIPSLLLSFLLYYSSQFSAIPECVPKLRNLLQTKILRRMEEFKCDLKKASTLF